MIDQHISPAMSLRATAQRQGRPPSVSIVIKALNEEAKISRCIEAALAALAELEGDSEIILADSISSDRTVEIAKRYPITVVQLTDVSDRGCGTGVQLGYQHSSGDFVMLLDGDMQLLPGFLPKALERMALEPGLAGVAGLVEETSIVNEFDRVRISSGACDKPMASARYLGGGGLYRRGAISDAGGYAGNRNLKAWEEAELGMRLTVKGWKLERIDVPSTLHTGHARSTHELLRAAWRSRRAMSNGVLIAQSLGKPWMWKAFSKMMLPLLVILLWAIAVGVILVGFMSQQWEWAVGFAIAMLLLATALVLYKRSFKRAIVSLFLYHYMAAALLLGLRDPAKDPRARISSVDLTSRAVHQPAKHASASEGKSEQSLDLVPSLTSNRR